MFTPVFSPVLTAVFAAWFQWVELRALVTGCQPD